MKIFTKGSILIGIAIDNGLINDPSERIIDYFPKILAGQEDIRKNELTIEHLLTMSAGFDWPEFGEWNYFPPMVYSPDIVRFVIDRELKDEPGQKMKWKSKSIVSSDWVTKSTHPNYSTYENIGDYGYHWWVKKCSHYRMYFALGYGGQYICIVLELKIVIFITSEMYEDTMKPLLLIEEFIMENEKHFRKIKLDL